MGVGRVLKWENQGLQHGSLDFSDYRFPSPVRQGDRSVGFRHGGHFSKHSLLACRLAKPSVRKISDAPQLFFHCAPFFFFASQLFSLDAHLTLQRHSCFKCRTAGLLFKKFLTVV